MGKRKSGAAVKAPEVPVQGFTASSILAMRPVVVNRLDVAFGGDTVATAMTARAFPSPLLRPITPDKLARVAVRGIGRRAARIAVPGRWIPISILRGIVNPIMDAAMERDAELIRLTAELDARRS